MQDTFARATHSALRQPVGQAQRATIGYFVYKQSLSAILFLVRCLRVISTFIFIMALESAFIQPSINEIIVRIAS